MSAYRPTAADPKKHGILKNLRKNYKDIVILQPHKGNGVVVLWLRYFKDNIEKSNELKAKYTGMKKLQVI